MEKLVDFLKQCDVAMETEKILMLMLICYSSQMQLQ
jgi:hypothetical protein